MSDRTNIVLTMLKDDVVKLPVKIEKSDESLVGKELTTLYFYECGYTGIGDLSLIANLGLAFDFEDNGDNNYDQIRISLRFDAEGNPKIQSYCLQDKIDFTDTILGSDLLQITEIISNLKLAKENFVYIPFDESQKANGAKFRCQMDLGLIPKLVLKDFL